MRKPLGTRFQLFGLDGLIAYDPDWRRAKLMREFEPSSLGDRPMTEAEKKAVKVRETNIEFITGKPGGGKSMMATKVIIDELLHGDRVIVTNLALNLSRLQEYIFELGGTALVVERVRLLEHEEVFKFYCIRGHHLVLEEPSHTTEVFDFSRSQAHHESAGGVFYVIDECHNYFSTKAKIDEESPMFKWASQHRKLKDLCYFVTQSIENVHAKVRRLGQQFNYIRNLRKETFRGFRRGDGFQRTVFLHIPSSDSAIPIHQESFKLDTSGLASCYFTAGGVGVKAVGNADGGFQKKGLHMRWIWGVYAGCVLGVVSLICIIPWGMGKGAEALVKSDDKKTTAPAAPVTAAVRTVSTIRDNGEMKLKTAVPAAVVASPGQPGDALAVPVYATGYVLGRGLITIAMSDGSTRTEMDSELQHIERNSIILSGQKIFFRPAPPSVKREVFSPDYIEGRYAGASGSMDPAPAAPGAGK